jgi:hypothetical protein
MATRANTMAAEQTIDRTAHAQAHERLRPSFDEIMAPVAQHCRSSVDEQVFQHA